MALAQHCDDLADMPFLDKDRYTEDEYFALEDRSPNRWEFVPTDPPGTPLPRLGIIRAMSGGTPDHSAIAGNLITALNGALRGTGNRMCRVFGSDLKVHTGDGRNTYPDVSVVCGQLTAHRRRRDIVTNPILIAEVLSPSTQADDKGSKWENYQTIPTLQHYLLITTEQPRVALYTREGDGWRFQNIRGDSTDAQFALSALGVTLALSDLYDLVEFETDDS